MWFVNFTWNFEGMLKCNMYCILIFILQVLREHTTSILCAPEESRCLLYDCRGIYKHIVRWILTAYFTFVCFCVYKLLKHIHGKVSQIGHRIFAKRVLYVFKFLRYAYGNPNDPRVKCHCKKIMLVENTRLGILGWRLITELLWIW